MVSNFPLITVIIPVYNTAPYLRKCLDSVCNQTYRELEIICVNDGSTDNSAEILEEYAARDSRVIVITQANAGLSVARNVAIEMSKGEWIASVDSDDWIEADTYEYFVRHIGNSTAKVAVIGVEMVKMPQQQVLQKSVMASGSEGEIEISPQLLVNNSDWFWNKIWKANFIKESGVRFPAGMWWEDVVFTNCLLPYIDKVLNLPQIKYHYIRNENGKSILNLAWHNPKALDAILSVEKVLQYHQEYPLPENMQAIKGLLLQKMYAYLTSPHIHTPETQLQAWNIMRRLVDEYNLLPNDETAHPELLLQYHTPPRTYAAIKTLERQVAQLNRQITQLNNKSKQIEKEAQRQQCRAITEIEGLCTKIRNLERQLVLTHQYSRLLRRYRITQIKLLFSWGARRRKYEERKQRIKQLIREYRDMRYKARRELQW